MFVIIVSFLLRLYFTR